MEEILSECIWALMADSTFEFGPDYRVQVEVEQQAVGRPLSAILEFLEVILAA
jgi:hypothetical protein